MKCPCSLLLKKDDITFQYILSNWPIIRFYDGEHELHYYYSLKEKVWRFRSLAQFQCSLLLSLSLRPSCVLAWQCNRSVLHRFCGRHLWDPSVWERTCAWLPIFLSLISIMHAPAIPPTASQSLSQLSHKALLHFVSHTKVHFSVCHQDNDWWGSEAFVFLIPPKSFWKPLWQLCHQCDRQVV